MNIFGDLYVLHIRLELALLICTHIHVLDWMLAFCKWIFHKSLCNVSVFRLFANWIFFVCFGFLYQKLCAVPNFNVIFVSKCLRVQFQQFYILLDWKTNFFFLEQTCEWNGLWMRNASPSPFAACENTTNAGDGICDEP